MKLNKKFILIMLMAIISIINGQSSLCKGAPEGGLVANPLDCRGYYLCHGENMAFGTCPTGMWFNPEKSDCDKGDCPMKPTDPSETTASTITVSNTQSPTEPSNQPSTDPSSKPSLCEGAPEGGLVANPLDCRGYYLCHGENMAFGTCPTGMWFNPEKSDCDKGDCPIQPTSPPETTTDDTITSSTTIFSSDSSTEPNNLSTDASTYPSTNLFTDLTTDSSNDSFTDPSTESPTEPFTDLSTNPTTELPTNPSTDASTKTPVEQNACENIPDGALVPNPFDCQGFYLCHDENFASGYCPTGMWFNPDKLECDMGDCPMIPTNLSETTDFISYKKIA